MLAAVFPAHGALRLPCRVHSGHWQRLLAQVRRRDLPPVFWEERRRALNRRRTLRQKEARRARAAEGQQG